MVVRWIRRAIVFWLVFLVGTLVAVDFGVRVLTQYLVARDIQSSLALKERPKVSFGGWPFIPELVSGTISSVTLSAQGAVTEQKFPVQSVDVSMQNVGFSLGNLLAGGGSEVTARSGTGTITMSEDDVNSAIPVELGVSVTLKDGEVTLTSGLVKGSITATVSVSGGQLVLKPDKKSVPEISIALPTLAQGVTFTSVSITGSTAVLTFELSRATFKT